MELYDFKSDFTNSVFRLMGRVILIAIVVQVVSSLISYLLIMFGAPELASLGAEMQSISQSTTDPEEIMEAMKDLLSANGVINYGAITLISLVSFIIGLITWNILYNGVRNEVGSGDNSLGSAFSGIFDVRLLKYFIISVLIWLGVSLVTLAVAATGISLLIIIWMVALIPFVCWLGISYSAVGIDNLSIAEAFKVSFKNLTFGRWGKTLGVGILIFIVFIIAAFIGALIGSLFGFIPGIGMVLSQIVGAAVNGVILAFFVAGFTGLYYRYTKSLSSEEEFIVTD